MTAWQIYKRLFKKGRELCGAGLRLALDMRAHVPASYTPRACPDFTKPLLASYLNPF